MNINEIHQFIDLIADKEVGTIPPGDKDKALDRASMWQFNEYRAIYGQNVEAYEALAPFKTFKSYATDSAGVYAVSAGDNYVQLLVADVAKVVDGRNRRYEVDIIKENELPARRNSQLLEPTAVSPIAVETGAGAFQFYPAQVHAGTLVFLRRPVAPVFGYTQAGRVITYSSGTSTQLEWTEPYLNKVIFKALEFLGINLDSDLLVKASQMLSQRNV